jgi:hypothetical protein
VRKGVHHHLKQLRNDKLTTAAEPIADLASKIRTNWKKAACDQRDAVNAIIALP